MLFNFLIFKIMKFSKYLMVAAAGLMMTACSQKDENPNGIDGVVALTVNVAGPASRTLVPGTADDAQIELKYGAEDGNVEIMLTAESGANVNTWVKLTSADAYTFYDVVNPEKIEVRINGGKPSYANLDDLKTLTPTTMKAYGTTEAKDFVFAGTTTNGGKTYDKYTATVTAQIPVGRIEVSGIKHKAHNLGKECVYSKLQIEGLYFDAANTTPDTPAEVTFETATDDLNKAAFTGDFLTETFPTGGNVAAFNFFPSTTAMPVLKLVFTGTTKDGKLVDAKRYAVVKTYRDAEGQPIKKFEAGKVYRITDVTIADDDYTGDESGNTTVAVEVTVAVQQWTIENTTVEF